MRVQARGDGPRKDDVRARHYPHTTYVNLHEMHYSYIQDIQMYYHSWRCTETVANLFGNARITCNATNAHAMKELNDSPRACNALPQPPPLCSHSERPDKEEPVRRHVTRFTRRSNQHMFIYLCDLYHEIRLNPV